jgi:paraquat-inducible protein A
VNARQAELARQAFRFPVAATRPSSSRAQNFMTIACPDCGTLQDLPPLLPRSTAVCSLCERDLEKTSGRSIDATLACAISTFVLLIPGNILPLVQVSVFGIHMQNVIGVGIARLWEHQWAVLAGLTAILVIAIPFLRFGLLSVVLSTIRLGYRPPWLGPLFRWSIWLDPWGMTDVFLLASAVGYYRLVNLSQSVVSIQLGGACFMAAGFLTMLSRATLDRRTVWRALGPEHETEAGEDTISCTTCDLVRDAGCEGECCPRCGAKLLARKPDAVVRTAALLVAALLFFFPANILPMEVSTQMGTVKNYTIFTGVSTLFGAGLWPLGALIFCTSILIPVAKIIAIGWCVMSVCRRSDRHLVLKTKLFRLVAELGRWSKTDPFTIVFFVPLMNFGPIASANASWGASAFIMMSILTMFASVTFDPRLMWDAAGSSPP